MLLFIEPGIDGELPGTPHLRLESSVKHRRYMYDITGDIHGHKLIGLLEKPR
tara:strand:+ start:3941 stop:4096 length:156 start_codon:yes stop_codon:yes gene_type:complete